MLYKNLKLTLVLLLVTMLVAAFAASGCVAPDGTLYALQPVVAANPPAAGVTATNKQFG